MKLVWKELKYNWKKYTLIGAAIDAGLVVLMRAALPQTMPFFLVRSQVGAVLCAFVLISILGSLATVIRVSKLLPLVRN